MNQKIDQFKNYFNDDLLSLADHKSPNTLWITRNLKVVTNQHYFRIGNVGTFISVAKHAPASAHGPIVNPPFHIELAIEEQAHPLRLKHTITHQ